MHEIALCSVWRLCQKQLNCSASSDYFWLEVELLVSASFSWTVSLLHCHPVLRRSLRSCLLWYLFTRLQRTHLIAFLFDKDESFSLGLFWSFIQEILSGGNFRFWIHKLDIFVPTLPEIRGLVGVLWPTVYTDDFYVSCLCSFS